MLEPGRWKPCVMRLPSGDTHWYLRDRKTDEVLDGSVEQFDAPPAYDLGRGCGFLTKQPSRRCQELLDAYYRDRYGQ